MMPAVNASMCPVPPMSYGMYANYQPQVGTAAKLLIYAGQIISVCLHVNHGGTNCYRCTQRLVILYA